MEASNLIDTKPNKKRAYMTNELAGKFKSKADFLCYCRNQVSNSSTYGTTNSIVQLQLYLPPDSAVNKDYMKLVFMDKKGFLENSKVKSVEVPLYDELSVKQLWPLMQ